MIYSKESENCMARNSDNQLLNRTTSTSKSTTKKTNSTFFVSLCREVVLEELDLPAIMENKAVKIVQRAITAVLRKSLSSFICWTSPSAKSALPVPSSQTKTDLALKKRRRKKGSSADGVTCSLATNGHYNPAKLTYYKCWLSAVMVTIAFDQLGLTNFKFSTPEALD